MKSAISILFISLLVSCYSSQPDKTGHEEEILPSFKLLKMDSVSVLETKDIPNGNPFIFFYFGPHCPYSKAQMVEIIEDINKLKAFHIYVISSWPFAEIRNFHNNYQLYKYPNITTGYDYNRSFTDYLEIQSVPYLVIFDKNKKLKQAFKGQTYSKQLIQSIQN